MTDDDRRMCEAVADAVSADFHTDGYDGSVSLGDEDRYLGQAFPRCISGKTFWTQHPWPINADRFPTAISCLLWQLYNSDLIEVARRRR